MSWVRRSGVGTAVVCWAVSPGTHLLLSVAVERRRITWRTEYPAVLVGDTALSGPNRARQAVDNYNRRNNLSPGDAGYVELPTEPIDYSPAP